jgi:predicted GIY-YIG superfamily endonuclease
MNYVYKIKEKKTDKVVYIGETARPFYRWVEHTKQSTGKFSKELHYMDVLDEFPFVNKKDAYTYQNELQSQYGFITDYDRNIKVLNSIIGMGPNSPKKQYRKNKQS